MIDYGGWVKGSGSSNLGGFWNGEVSPKGLKGLV